MTYKYVSLCHKSRDFSSSFALLPIADHPPKLEVIFCVQAVISPILANLYLHHVLDVWAQAWRRKVAQGEVIIVRYADDAVLGFQNREDADRFLKHATGTAEAGILGDGSAEVPARVGIIAGLASTLVRLSLFKLRMARRGAVAKHQD